MPSDRHRARLSDILHNIVRARLFIGEMTFEQFAADEKTIYATVRALEIISEGSRHLPDDLKARHSSVDWVAVRDAGNVYRHAYESVTERRIWDTVILSLSDLEAAVRKELA